MAKTAKLAEFFGKPKRSEWPLMAKMVNLGNVARLAELAKMVKLDKTSRMAELGKMAKTAKTVEMAR